MLFKITCLLALLPTILCSCACPIVKNKQSKDSIKLPISSLSVLAMRDPILARKYGLEHPGSYVFDLSLIQLLQLAVPASIGTPEQSLPLVLDTVRSDTWVPSILCNTPGCSSLSLNSFNSSKSETYKDLGLKKTIDVSDYIMTNGQLSGRVSEDQFQLAGRYLKSRFLLVDEATDPRPSTLLQNGRLGIGSTLHSNQEMRTSILVDLKDTIPAQLYSVYLQDFVNYGIVGGLEIGGFDVEKIDVNSMRSYANYDPAKDNWSMLATSMAAKTVPLGSGKPIIMAVDLSTPFMTLPLEEMNAMALSLGFDKIGTKMRNAQNGGIYYNIPCRYAQESIGDITLSFGQDQEYTITPEEYLIGDGEHCVAMLFGLDMAGDEKWILGNMFFRKRMVVFDLDTQSISIASLKQSV